MTTTMLDPQLLEELEQELHLPPIHHIDVCPGCESKAVVGTLVRCRCGHIKAIEGFLPHPSFVSCPDCREARAVCAFCGKQRGEGCST